MKLGTAIDHPRTHWLAGLVAGLVLVLATSALLAHADGELPATVLGAGAKDDGGKAKPDAKEDIKQKVATANIIDADKLPNYRVMVVANGKFGYISLKGDVTIPCQFDAAKQFSEDLALVQVNGKWGFIDPMGKFVIPAKYDKAASFKEGKAEVTIGDQYGYIDKTEKWVYGPLTIAKFLESAPADPQTLLPAANPDVKPAPRAPPAKPDEVKPALAPPALVPPSDPKK